MRGLREANRTIVTLPLLGRDRELGIVYDLVDHAPERGGALVVRGEAGIGKSSLLAATGLTPEVWYGVDGTDIARLLGERLMELDDATAPRDAASGTASLTRRLSAQFYQRSRGAPAATTTVTARAP